MIQTNSKDIQINSRNHDHNVLIALILDLIGDVVVIGLHVVDESTQRDGRRKNWNVLELF